MVVWLQLAAQKYNKKKEVGWAVEERVEERVEESEGGGGGWRY